MSQAELDMASQGPDLAPAISTLLATDGSDHALKAARFVAGILPAGAQIRLLVVLSMELQPRTYLGDLSDAEARRARIEEATEEAVAETRRILQAAGHPVSVHRRFGNPPDETLAEVEGNCAGPSPAALARISRGPRANPPRIARGGVERGGDDR